MTTLTAAFNAVAHYPKAAAGAVFGPIEQKEFDHATDAKRTWYGRAVSQSLIGVRAGVIAYPAFMVIAMTAASWGVQGRSIEFHWLDACVIAPVIEEFFYRGVCQSIIKFSATRILGDNDKDQKISKMLAIGIVSVAFGGAHGFNITAFTTIMMGASFGYLKEQTNGGLLAPIAMHATNNTLSTALPIVLGAIENAVRGFLIK